MLFYLWHKNGLDLLSVSVSISVIQNNTFRDSPTPRASPPPASVSDGGPTPTQTEVAEVGAEQGAEETEALFVPSSDNTAVVLPEISLTPPLRSDSPNTEDDNDNGENEHIDVSVIEHEEVFVAEMSPDPVSSQPPVTSPLPETRSEAMSLLISHLTSERWKEVWRLWRGCRNLWDSVYTLGCEAGSLNWSQAHQDTEDLTHILNIYCRHLADTREGIFVMTVSSVDLGSVCASLMDISLQLLASVKSLERSLSQVR